LDHGKTVWNQNECLREVYRPLTDEINDEFRKLYNEKFGGFFMFLVNKYIKKIKSIHRPETL